MVPLVHLAHLAPCGRPGQALALVVVGEYPWQVVQEELEVGGYPWQEVWEVLVQMELVERSSQVALAQRELVEHSSLEQWG